MTKATKASAVIRIQCWANGEEVYIASSAKAANVQYSRDCGLGEGDSDVDEWERRSLRIEFRGVADAVEIGKSISLITETFGAGYGPFKSEGEGSCGLSGSVCTYTWTLAPPARRRAGGS